MTDQTVAKSTKKDLERKALVDAIAARGEVPPPSSDLTAILGAGRPPAPEAAPAAPAPAPVAAKPAAPHVQRARKAAKPKEPDAPPADAPATPPAQAKQPTDDAPPAPLTAQVIVSEDELAELMARRHRRDQDASAPWANAHPKFEPKFQLRLPEKLHLQLTWLSQHLPDTSMHKLALDAVAERIETLLDQYYVPPEQK